MELKRETERKFVRRYTESTWDCVTFLGVFVLSLFESLCVLTSVLFSCFFSCSELQPLIEALDNTAHIERYFLPKVTGGSAFSLDDDESKKADPSENKEADGASSESKQADTASADAAPADGSKDDDTAPAAASSPMKVTVSDMSEESADTTASSATPETEEAGASSAASASS